MTNLQYADRNRFYVSLGLALITLAFLLPWLVLKEPLEVHTTLNEIAQLNDISQLTVKIRQIMAISLLAISCLASPFLIIPGIALVVIGVIRWEKMESIEEREKIAKSVETITDIEEKKKTKVITIESQMLITLRQALNELVAKDPSLTLEKEFNSGDYIFDYIIRSSDNLKPHILIKTKFSNGAWVKYEKILELFYMISPRSYKKYKKQVKANVRTVGFMFLPDIHKISSNNRLISLFRFIFPAAEVKIETKSSIAGLTCNELASLFYNIQSPKQ